MGCWAVACKSNIPSNPHTILYRTLNSSKRVTTPIIATLNHVSKRHKRVCRYRTSILLNNATHTHWSTTSRDYDMSIRMHDLEEKMIHSCIGLFNLPGLQHAIRHRCLVFHRHPIQTHSKRRVHIMLYMIASAEKALRKHLLVHEATYDVTAGLG
jgi:hypothetical protein